VVLRAWRHLHRVRRDNAAMLELPHAQHMALLANINRDPKKGKSFTAADFTMFQPPQHDETKIPAAAASVAMELRHENKLPEIALAAWPQILSNAPQTPIPVQTRALRSDDNEVWVIAPVWEDRNIRGGLVAVGRYIDGPITLRDVDRPLMTYKLRFPVRKIAGYVEASLLLVTEN
jgi:hypothetical protein